MPDAGGQLLKLGVKIIASWGQPAGQPAEHQNGREAMLTALKAAMKVNLKCFDPRSFEPARAGGESGGRRGRGGADGAV